MDNFSNTARAPTGDPSPLLISLLGSSDDMLATRNKLDGWLRHQNPAPDAARLFDIVLAANELMSNALDYGDDGCIVDVRRIGRSVALTVTNSAHDAVLPPVSRWEMPDCTQLRGRGLAIVETLADTAVLTVTPTSVSIAATFDLTVSTAPILDRTTAVAS